LCQAQSWNGGFVLAPAVTRVQVLRSEDIFTFQLTAHIGLSKEGGAFKSLKITLGGYR